jgi:hypothetical protein
MNNLTRSQKTLITRLKNLQNGRDGKKVKHSTLIKHNLIHLVEEYKSHITFPSKTTTQTTTQTTTHTNKDKHTETAPYFTKQDIIDFIKSYDYNNATRNVYLTNYDNSRHRDSKTNFPDFTSADIIADNTFELFITHPRGKQILNPIPKFLESKYFRDGRWNCIETRRLRDKISNQIAKFREIEGIHATQKNSHKNVAITKEQICDFYTKLITTNTELFMTEKERDYDNLARCFSILTAVQCRDDIGTMLINPVDELRDTTTWIDLHTGTLSITPKKMSDKRTIIELPQRNLTWLRKDFQKYPRKYLLTKTKDPNTPRGVVSYQFGRWMTKHYGKLVGLTDIRKAYTSWSLENNTAEEYIELAKAQGHSTDIAIRYYNQRIPENNNSQD